MTNKRSPSDPITLEEFERYKRFVTMQIASFFVEMENLKDEVKIIKKFRPIPTARRDTLDQQVQKVLKKINFLEARLRTNGPSSNQSGT